jgi:hypothetical protein
LRSHLPRSNMGLASEITSYLVVHITFQGQESLALAPVGAVRQNPPMTPTCRDPPTNAIIPSAVSVGLVKWRPGVLVEIVVPVDVLCYIRIGRQNFRGCAKRHCDLDHSSSPDGPLRQPNPLRLLLAMQFPRSESN